jgi:hypothetical protein
MRIRAATLAAVLGLAAAGCGDNPTCNDQTPPLRTGGVPSCLDMAASVPVTVQLGVCPRCDQSAPRCVVRMENVAAFNDIQLEPLSEVCEASASCPIINPDSCPFTPLTCSFTAPAAGNYDIVVIDASGTERRGNFTVINGGATACTL